MSKPKSNNLTIKIVAVFIAAILWTYVMSEVNPRITREFKNVSVNLLNLELVERAGLVLMEPKEVSISVKVAGRRSDVLSMTDADIVAQADLNGYSEGSNKVPIEVIVPGKVENVEIEPKNILFKLDKIVSKEKAVTLNITGKIANGYSLGAGEIRPSNIYINGPGSWVNSVANVIASVDVTGVTSDIKVSVPVRALNDDKEEVRDIGKEPGIVEINIPVYPTKSVTINPQIEGEPAEGYEITSITTNPDKLTIRGYQNYLNTVYGLDTIPINVEGINQSFEGLTELVIPDNVELLDKDTIPTVSIKVEKIVEKTFEYEIGDIEFLNKKTDLKLQTAETDESISLTVRGIESIINNLTQNDISLYIDLEGIGEGVHELSIEAAQLQNVEILEMSPNKVKITLNKEETF